MSGSGRKTHYRKSVTEEFLNGLPVPEENEVICKTHSSRGTNIFEIELASGEMELAMLPNKFKKLIWVKRGDYLIVSTTSGSSSSCSVEGGEESGGGGGGGGGGGEEMKVQYLVKNILQKDQIAHLQKLGLWPSEFVLDAKLTRREVAADDLMPDYDSGGSDCEYEEEEEVLVDKMGNTIEPTLQQGGDDPA